MKRAWILPLAFSAALPLLADEPKSEPKPAAEPQATATTTAPETTPVVATDTAATTDSPLVAAAKRANRRGRKGSATVVITNETLSQTGANAHITTTEKQHPISPSTPTRSTAAKAQAQNGARTEKAPPRGESDEAKTRAEAEEKLAKRAAAAEDGYDGGQGDDADELVAGADQKPPVH